MLICKIDFYLLDHNSSFLTFGLIAYCQERNENYFLSEKSLTIPSLVSFTMIDFMITSLHMEDERLPFQSAFEILTNGRKERIIMQRQMYLDKQQVCSISFSIGKEYFLKKSMFGFQTQIRKQFLNDKYDNIDKDSDSYRYILHQFF